VSLNEAVPDAEKTAMPPGKDKKFPTIRKMN
jgi:hypothetical protein